MEERKEFTPGPWKAFDVSEMHDEPRFMVGPREYCSIAEVRAGSTEAEETGGVAANARLIAASPDMAEALKPFAEFARELFARNYNRSDRLMSIGDADLHLSVGAFFDAHAALLLANTGGTGNE